MANKDKWYVPSEFKGLKKKGGLQIAIGITIAVFGAFNPNQGILYVIGGIVWAVVGVCLVIANYIEENKETSQSIDDKGSKRNDPGDNYDDEL